jgi:hypothetical protein
MTKLSHQDNLRIKGIIGLDAYSPEALVEWIASIGKTVESVSVLRSTHGQDAFLNAWLGEPCRETNPDYALFD